MTLGTGEPRTTRHRPRPWRGDYCVAYMGPRGDAPAGYRLVRVVKTRRNGQVSHVCDNADWPQAAGAHNTLLAQKVQCDTAALDACEVYTLGNHGDKDLSIMAAGQVYASLNEVREKVRAALWLAKWDAQYDKAG